MSAVKALMSSRPVAYYPELARAVGGIAPALFFQQIAHWQGKNPEGWVYRTQDELEEELAMSPKVQASARDHLIKRGLLEEKRDGMPRRLYYRPVWDNLESALQTLPMASTDSPDGQVQSSPSGDTTLKNSNENRKDTSNDVEAGASPGQFVGYLREELDGADVPLLRNREERYAAEFNRHIKKGISREVLYKVCDRINERWRSDDHRKLTAEQALEDVVNGKPPMHVIGDRDKVNRYGVSQSERDEQARRNTEGYEEVFSVSGGADEPAEPFDKEAMLADMRGERRNKEKVGAA